MIPGPISHRKNLRPSPSSSSASTLTIPIEKQLMSPRVSVITPLVVLPRASHQPKQQSPFGQRKVQDNGDTLNSYLLIVIITCLILFCCSIVFCFFYGFSLSFLLCFPVLLLFFSSSLRHFLSVHLTFFLIIFHLSSTVLQEVIVRQSVRTFNPHHHPALFNY